MSDTVERSVINKVATIVGNIEESRPKLKLSTGKLIELTTSALLNSKDALLRHHIEEEALYELTKRKLSKAFKITPDTKNQGKR